MITNEVISKLWFKISLYIFIFHHWHYQLLFAGVHELFCKSQIFRVKSLTRTLQKILRLTKRDAVWELLFLRLFFAVQTFSWKFLTRNQYNFRQLKSSVFKVPHWVILERKQLSWFCHEGFIGNFLWVWYKNNVLYKKKYLEFSRFNVTFKLKLSIIKIKPTMLPYLFEKRNWI